MSYLGWSPWPGESVAKILKFFVTYGTASRMGHFVQTTAILGYWEVIFEKWYYKNKPPYFPTTFTFKASLKQVWKISEYSIYTRHVWDSFVWKIQWILKFWLLWLEYSTLALKVYFMLQTSSLTILTAKKIDV